MEEINKAMGGLNSDVHPAYQPAHTVRDMNNFVPMSIDGNLNTIENSDGNILTSVVFPNGFEVIGHYLLNTDLIVVLVKSDGNGGYYSQVGVITEEMSGFEYEAVAPVDSNGDVPINNSELGFSLNHPVQCEARKLIDGHRVLYYTDNNIEPGRVDLDNPPLVGSVKFESSLVPDMKIPQISFEVEYGRPGSKFKPGMVQIVTRYITDSGGATFFGLPSNPIKIYNGDSAQSTEGGYNEFDESNNPDGYVLGKSYNLIFNNVDTNYKNLEVFVIYYEGDFSPVPRCTRLVTLPISSDKAEYSMSSIDTEEALDITLDEVNAQATSYNRAKCISQKDNTLFLGNLSSSSTNDELQEIANAVEVSYRVKSVPYSNREYSDSQDESFTISNSFITGPNTINIVASSPFLTHESSASEYKYYIDKAPASGFVLINSIPAAGEQVTITPASGSDIVLTFVSGTPSSDSEIEIGTDEASCALSLSTTINNLIEASSFTSYIDSGDPAKCNIYVNDSKDEATLTVGASMTKEDLVLGSSEINSSPSSVSKSGDTIVLSFNSIVYAGGKISSDSNFSGEGGVVDGFDLNVIPVISSDTDGASSSITDYVNENIISSNASYRRGEVYSLGFGLLYNNGSTSPVFHIPGSSSIGSSLGKNDHPSWSSNKNQQTGELGAFVSSLDYQRNSIMPGDLPGDDNSSVGQSGLERNIRHHLMPDLSTENHVSFSGGSANIRILTLDFNFVKSIPSSVLDNVQEVLFFRESRSEGNSKSVIAQGLLNKMCVTADKFNKNNGNVDGSGVYQVNGNDVNINSKVLPSIFDGVASINSWPGEGLAYQGKSSGSNMPDAGDMFRDDHAVFICPESTFNSVIRGEDLSSATLRPLIAMEDENFSISGPIISSTDQPDQGEWSYEETKGRVYSNKDGTNSVGLEYYPSMKSIFNYNKIHDITINDKTDVTIDKGRTNDSGKNPNDQLSSDTYKYLGKWTEKLIEIVTTTPIKERASNYSVEMRGFAFSPGFDPDGSPDGRDYAVKIQGNNKGNGYHKYLYNIETEIPSQYGSIGGNYLLIGREPTGSSSYYEISGGDTYITKYHHMTESIVPWQCQKRVNGSSSEYTHRQVNDSKRAIMCKVDGRDNLVHPEGSLNDGFVDGASFITNYYFFVESDINTYLRHSSDNGEYTGTYFPKNSWKSAYEGFYGWRGNESNYNAQYSLGPIARTYSTIFNQTVVSKFENRIIYSIQAANDDTSDSYRVFLQNDYYDLPAHKGPIWNMPVVFNTLYAHTPKSLWKTFAEPAATLDSQSIGEVVLGTGALFQRPSQELMTTEGGYGGTVSQFGGVHTNFGYMFVDQLQKKIFALTPGPNMRDLTENTISTFVNNNMETLKSVDSDNSSGIDNPYQGVGFTGGYDYRLGIAYLSNLGNNPWTLGFSSKMNSFFGFFDYRPDAFIQYNNRLLEIKDSEIWEANKGSKNNFYGVLKDSYLEIVAGTANQQAKVFDQLVIDSEEVDNETFTNLKVDTNSVTTGDKTLVTIRSKRDRLFDGNAYAVSRNEEFRVSIPKSTDRSRIKGDFSKIRLSYNKSKKFVLKQIMTIFRVNNG